MPAGVDQAEIERIGRTLFAHARAAAPTPLSRAWWTARVLEWAMHDPQFKTDLFRFVDVLPALRSRDALVRHVTEYFDPVRHRTPAAVEQLLARLNRGRVGAWAAEGLARQVRRMAQQFIIGETAVAALPKLQRLSDANQAFSIDVLGEACLSEAEAAAYQRAYLDLIPALSTAAARWPSRPRLHDSPGGPLPRANVSVKLSALYPHRDAMAWDRSVAELTERLRPIFRAARAADVAINVDMEEAVTKDLTIAVFQRLCDEREFRDWPHAGLALQAYLTSADQDTAAFVEWAHRRGTPVTVRLVKGAYWDYELVVARQRGWPVPVWGTKPETDAAFERCARVLLAAYPTVQTALASHNIRSLAAGLAAARAEGVPQGGLEVQMLYGMGEAVRGSVVEHGERLRVYAPVGQLIPGMAYLVRRLLENTSNEGFLVQRLAEDVAEEDLLRDPTTVEASAPETDAPPPAQWLTDARDPGPFVNTPTTDFSVAAHRDAFDAALETVRGTFPLPVRAYIDGWREGSRVFDSVSPNAPDFLIARVAEAGLEQVHDAVAAAGGQLAPWGGLRAHDRAAVLFRAADLMRQRRFALAALQVYEVGKAWREADADVVEAIDFCEYYGREAIRLGGSHRTQDVDGEVNDLVYQPRGIAAVIPPWNFPLAIAAGMTAAALVTGNPVVLKPASAAAAIAAGFVDILYEAGLPPGVLQFLPGPGGRVGAALAAHPDVALIAFTGSRAVGLDLLRMAGSVDEGQRHFKKLICELGGKNAIIVDDDADLDMAVQGIVDSAFGYQGQKCSACSRAIVVGDAYDTFAVRLVEAVRSLPLGDVRDPATRVGAVIDAAAQARIREYIDLGRRDGRVLVECAAPAGYGVGPIVFGDLGPDHPLAQEEIFGPVLTVLRAPTFAAALDVANGTRYALTGGVYSRSPGHLAQARAEYRVGNLYLNRGITGAVVQRQPFGGLRQSGLGSKAGGAEYLLQFCEPRTISENTLRRGFAPPLEP